MKRLLDWLRRRMPPWVTILLLAPLIYVVAVLAHHPLMSIVNGRLPRYVLSGRLFTECFDIIHAGSALDQPTIGKWMFWFTVLASLTAPYVAIVRRITNRDNPFGYWLFAIGVVALSALLLSILAWPTCWLVQYIHSMGFTPKRVFGLVYGFASAIMLPIFVYWMIRRPRARDAEIEPN